MKNMRNAFSILLLVCVVSGMLVAEKKRDSLEKMQLLVGQWRGAGLINRGSTVGGWIESSSWQWEFDKEAALVFETDKGKYRLLCGYNRVQALRDLDHQVMIIIFLLMIIIRTKHL